MSAYTNPHGDDDPAVGRFKRALFARGTAGTMLWFAILAAAIITLTLIANRCGSDDDADEIAAATAEPTTTPEPEATPEAAPEPTTAPDPTPEAEPEPEPEPAPAAEVLVQVDDDAIITLLGTVPDQAAMDALVSAAQLTVGNDRVANELTIDPEATAGLVVTTAGSLEESTAEQLVDSLNAIGPVTDVVDQLDPIASVDVVAALNEAFAIQPVQFALGSAEILDGSTDVLNEVAAELLDAPGLALEIQGHTDDSGDEASNQTLSQRRAESVLAYLVDTGVSADRLTAAGFGESAPIADNATLEGQQANRRIEFEIQ